MELETVTLKIQKETANEIDKVVKEQNYGTKTEFIREAIRERLKEIKKELAWQMFVQLKGKAKKHVSDEEAERIGEQVFEEYAKKRGWKLD